MIKVNELNLRGQIVNEDEFIKEDTDIVLINSFGSLNKYYDYCKHVFIGKSLKKELILEGGQNPIEAARFGCEIFHGPNVQNFTEVYRLLQKENFTHKFYHTNQLVKYIDKVFSLS